MKKHNTYHTRRRRKNKTKRKVMLIFAIPFLIAFIFTGLMFMFLGNGTPSASESMVENYKKAAALIGCTWQELLVYDTVRYENDLEDVNPYMSATDFIQMRYEEYEWIKTDMGGYWQLKTKGTLVTLSSIYKWLGIEDGSDISDIIDAVAKFKEPQYVLQILPIDLDTLIIQKGFDEDQIRWVDMLMTSGILEDMFGDIYDLPDYIESAEGGYFAWPTPELHTVTSKFASSRKHPVLGITRPHNGVDISGTNPMGSPVISIDVGTVILVDSDGGERGMNIKVQHNIGKDVWISRYQHLSVIKVSVGDKVDRGTVVGAVGNSGIGTGPHLHIELTYNGVLIDPLSLMQE